MLKYLVGFKPFFMSDWDRVARVQDGGEGLRIFLTAEKMNAFWRSSRLAGVFIFSL
jgi:hypothetical protein